MTAPAILPDAIENLRSLTPDDGGEFLREVIQIYLEDTPQRIADLSRALASADTALFTRSAHSVKGSSSNVGAESVRQIAEALEHQSKREGLAGLAARLPELEAAFADAKSALEAISAASRG